MRFSFWFDKPKPLLDYILQGVTNESVALAIVHLLSPGSKITAKQALVKNGYSERVASLSVELAAHLEKIDA